ncbi:ATP-binding domain-containing protein [Herbaspirillum sp. SJZ107]|uniref:ATP-binding domain-containing protein n=1 Tax=Herbaspirillum sp. SJZ107 TaxID=2572881 RepID=UPI00114E1A8C|nr:ATP-binding domain-containing protein [Herbaspirillum sp. SJZ107]TQK03466.1 AAA domain-containing protein [Herbaspirillum sp. SJZ107]
MAAISPALIPPLRMDAGRYRELEILECLRDHLPAGFEVFHNIALHTIRGGRDCYGEIDVIVMSPDGVLLIMEVKAGPVLLRNGEIFKLYGDGECDVARQGRLQRVAMQNRLQEAGLQTTLQSCLVLPDYELGNSQVISIPRDRIIDATRYGDMVSTVRNWLGAAHSKVDRDALRRLLLNQFHVTPDLGVMRDQLRGTVRRLSDGLATWVPRIESPSGVFRVQATAGSGKTQLALQLLEGAVAEGLNASYTCFNRTLADHVRRLASPKVQVVNYHELCVEHYRRVHGEPDFSPQGFQRMADAYLAASEGFTRSLDLLVIDEAQDFDAGWVESLCNRLKPGARLYVLEDDAQRLYQHDGFELGDAVTIRCSDNFRSPRVICDVINSLSLVQPPVRGLNPYPGQVPEIRTYGSDDELLARTQAAVASLLTRGFALDDIAVVCGRGRERSVLLNRAGIGPWLTRRFTGEYDRNGEPRWSQGELLVESVYRYKGQSSPAVVVAEFDFAELDDAARRRLFVALTRAQMTAELVLSSRAEQCMSEALARD